MDRPHVDLTFSLKRLPLGPHYPSGQLHEISAGMRTFRPLLDPEACVGCLRCFLLCPDGAIDKSGAAPEIDYDYCKGCGICARACRAGAIRMMKEAEG